MVLCTLLLGSRGRYLYYLPHLPASYYPCYAIIAIPQLSSSSQEDLLKRVANQIPPELAPKISGIFYKLYHEEQEKHGSVDYTQLFYNFYNPTPILTEHYHVDVVDEPWFSHEANTQETHEYTSALAQAYQQKRGRGKRYNPAHHDALVIRWILHERERTSKDVRLITIDKSLPTFTPPGQPALKPPLSISLVPYQLSTKGL